MPLNFPKQKCESILEGLEGGGGGEREESKAPVYLCLFLAAVHPLWGLRRQKEKGKQPNGSVPPSAIYKCGRENPSTLM